MFPEYSDIMIDEEGELDSAGVLTQAYMDMQNNKISRAYYEELKSNISYKLIGESSGKYQTGSPDSTRGSR
jgi:hypothetical protein